MTNSLVYFRLSICLFSIKSQYKVKLFQVFCFTFNYKMKRLTRTLLIMADKAKMVAQSRTVLKLRKEVFLQLDLQTRFALHLEVNIYVKLSGFFYQVRLLRFS